MSEIPMIKFMVPHDCIVCGKREESNKNMYRIDLNEFRVEQLAKLPGKYLGQHVHKNPDCLNKILTFTKQ